MVRRLTQALDMVKEDLPQLIAKPVSDFLAAHPEHVYRRRLLDPFNTLMLFILQVLHANTAINHLRHLSDLRFTATAFCKARARLPLALLQSVLDQVVGDFLSESDKLDRWRGHRIWSADATSFNTPDTAELRGFYGHHSAQKDGCGFPTAWLMCLCSRSGFIRRFWDRPMNTHEASQVANLHDDLEEGDVLLYDRAACSYAHLALISLRKLHAIIRMHQKRIVSFRPGRRHAAMYPAGQRQGRPQSRWIKRLGPGDQLVAWFKPGQRPRWMSPEAFVSLPDELTVRELRYRITRRGFRTQSVTLVTTLLDPKAYPAEELAEQYLDRWEIEVNFRHLKTTLKMEKLKCKTVEGVRKELMVFALVYNLVRLVMLRAAVRQRVGPNRISFIDALRLLCRTRSTGEIVLLIVNPKRIGRVEPRVIKSRPKPYTYMTKPRDELRQLLIKPKDAA